MEFLRIKGSPKFPFFKGNPETGFIEVYGRCIPENPTEEFQPLLKWVDEYISNGKFEVNFEIALEYFNTSSTKVLTDTMRTYVNLHKAGKINLSFLWVYEDDDFDLKETGEFMSIAIDFPIKMKEIEEFDFDLMEDLPKRDE